MTQPTWSDPPPIGGPQDPRAVYCEQLRPLTSEPGRWALIKSGTPAAMQGLAQALKQRQYHIPPGEWEFTVRSYRRGVHVGGRNAVAQCYGRFMREWEEDEPERRGYRSGYRIYNDAGRRVCEDCYDVLPYPEGGGSYSHKCDACWDKADTKWARLRRKRIKRLGGDGHPQAPRYQSHPFLLQSPIDIADPNKKCLRCGYGPNIHPLQMVEVTEYWCPDEKVWVDCPGPCPDGREHEPSRRTTRPMVRSEVQT